MGSQQEIAWAWLDPMGSQEHELYHMIVSPELAFCTSMLVSHGLPAATGRGGV